MPPIFYSGERERPERAGTCVLLNVLGCPVIATAAHALRKVGGQLLWLMPPSQEHLVSLGPASAFFTPDEDEPQALDVGFIPCTPQHISILDTAGFAFIPEAALDAGRHSNEGDYVVFGWPESSRQFRVDHRRRHIQQRSFSF